MDAGAACRAPNPAPASALTIARKRRSPTSNPALAKPWSNSKILLGKFSTATDLNHALGQVFRSLAQDRIPPRNAAALGYLAQLLLQTLPGVKSEFSKTLAIEPGTNP